MREQKAPEIAVVAEQRPEMVDFERNLEDLALFGSHPKDAETGYLEYVERYRMSDGSEGQKRVRFKPPDELGDLGQIDQDVYVAIKALVQMRGGMPKDGRLRFTVYELLQLLGLADNGQNFVRVREALLRIGKTQVDAENAFYNKSNLSYESEHFNVWRVSFKGNIDKFGRASERHTIRFDEVIIRSYMAGYVKQLDVNFYLSLDKTHARSMYRCVDSKRGDDLAWSVELTVLRELLGMKATYRYPSKIKEKLQGAVKELKHKGFLRSVTFPTKDQVRFEVAPEFVSERSHLERSWTMEENGAIRMLIRNGVWANVAPGLVASRGVETCTYYVDALPYQKGVRNTGAWLNKYIEEKLPPPVEPPQRRLEAADEVASGEDELEASGSQMDAVSIPDPDAQSLEVWGAVLEAAAEEISSPSLQVWFEGTVPISLRDGCLTLSVPNLFAKEYIESRFAPILLRHLRELVGEAASIEVYARATHRVPLLSHDSMST